MYAEFSPKFHLLSFPVASYTFEDMSIVFLKMLLIVTYTLPTILCTPFWWVFLLKRLYLDLYANKGKKRTFYITLTSNVGGILMIFICSPVPLPSASFHKPLNRIISYLLRLIRGLCCQNCIFYFTFWIDCYRG